MRRVDHLLDTVDCAHPGCIDEAAKGSEFCSDHRPGGRHHTPPASHTEQARQARLERMFGSTTATEEDPEALVFASTADALQYLRDGTTPAPPAPPAPEETPVTTCKIDGCDQPCQDAAKTSPYYRLCDQHRTEMRQRVGRVSERRQARAAATVKPPPAAPTPEPAPAPQKAAVADQTPLGRIAGLEATVADLEKQLATARQELHAAATAYVDELRERYGIAA